jgi:two-component system, LytTR family, sensor kinase
MTRKNRILLEVFFFVFIFIAYQGEGFNISRSQLFISFIVYIILYAHGLINRFFILKFLFPLKKYLRYVVLTLINLFIFSVLLNNIENIYAQQFDKSIIPYLSFYTSVTSCLLSLFIMSTVEFVVQYFKIEKEKADYKLLINELENNSLKAQLNPHFLFNSLNNAYGISLSEPNRLPNYIMQLSQLMRYQLESSKSNTESIADEILFVENYLSIEKERIGQRCKITFTDTIDQHVKENGKIAPLIFMAFIENAIKHGASAIEPSFINIEFFNKDMLIYFKIINSIAKQDTTGTEVGLKNVQQRLKIMYPNKHELLSSIIDNNYTVSLKVQTTQNA